MRQIPAQLNPRNHLLRPMDYTVQMLPAPTPSEDAAEEQTESVGVAGAGAGSTSLVDHDF